ncbi:MAG: hypothetical protein KIT18_09400 [Burkholderiales bacterium]|nr:hypothetical protein [Burkholderiales bacterium]
MKIAPPYYPVIYIRGFAATMGEIEDTVADPYMGFNLGSTKIRQDWQQRIVRHIFESPLIRLMKDEGYADTYAGGDFIAEDRPVPARSIWIFRYYEPASKDLGAGKRQEIPEIAIELRRFILRVRRQVCMTAAGRPDAAALQAFRVCLVAHSMGGLVARCYLQNICADGVKDAALRKELELDAGHCVDKVFTYGTPHNGIEMLGINTPNLGALDGFHLRNFNRDVMRDYLKLPKHSERVDTLNGKFPPERFFCMIGTNYRDYTAFFKLSRHATGAMGDGLVLIENAAVQDAPRAFAHRGHSGHYGIVNSEEGYQNLRRFLFGDFRVDARLAVDDISLPGEVEAERLKGRQVRASYHIECTAQVRGARYCLHERTVDHECAVFRSYEDWAEKEKPAYLFSGFIYSQGKSAQSQDKSLAFSIRLAIKSPEYEVERRFWPDAHFEGADIYVETLTFFVTPGRKDAKVTYGLASEDATGAAPRELGKLPAGEESTEFEIPIGFEDGDGDPPRPGFRGRLLLDIRQWNEEA